MRYKSAIVDNQEVIYSADWVMKLETRQHFMYYWNQLDMVYTNVDKTRRILELGVGAHFLSDILKRRGFVIKTLDIDPDKHADYTASALDFDYDTESFDTLLAFEVFEHIPFLTLQKVIGQVSQSGIQQILFSVPACQRSIVQLSVKMPFLGMRDWSLRVPAGRIRTPAHFWELGRTSRTMGENKELISLTQMTSVFTDQGWSLTKLRTAGIINFFMASR